MSDLLNRRDALVGMCSATAAAVLNACAISDAEGPGASCDGVAATSSTESGHTHSVCVPNADLEAQPATAQYRTSEVSGHSHTLALNKAQLTTLAGGGSVQAISGAAEGHSHSFTLG